MQLIETRRVMQIHEKFSDAKSQCSKCTSAVCLLVFGSRMCFVRFELLREVL